MNVMFNHIYWDWHQGLGLPAPRPEKSLRRLLLCLLGLLHLFMYRLDPLNVVKVGGVQEGGEFQSYGVYTEGNFEVMCA